MSRLAMVMKNPKLARVAKGARLELVPLQVLVPVVSTIIALGIGLLIIAGCLGLEHWIIRKRSLEWAEKSFFKLNALISVIFITVVIAEVALIEFWSFKGG